MMQPELVVLQADLPDESGWLTCDKLTGEFPTVKVVLVAADLQPRLADFADFVGAEALVSRRDGAAGLLPRVREYAMR
jgi:DNA-binding NarL/FixJ family response regulator